VVALGVHLLAPDADERQQSVAGGVEPHDQRQDGHLQALDHRRHPEHRPLRALQRQGLRHHFADHDVHVGQQCDRPDARERVHRHPAVLAERRQRGLDPHGQRVLAVHAQADAGNRDADLRGGDEPVLPAWVVQDAGDALRQPAALAGRVLDGRARRADDRELGRDEERVGQYQGRDDADDERDVAHSGTAEGGASGVAITQSTARSAARSIVNWNEPIVTVSPDTGR
jgi:hypothetical protein